MAIDEAIILDKLNSFFNETWDKYALEILKKRKEDKDNKLKELIKTLLDINTSDNKDVKAIVDVLKKLLEEGFESDDLVGVLDEYNNRYNFSKSGKYKNNGRNERTAHHLSRINHHLEQLRKHNPRLHKQLSHLHHI
jgi:hypothetical protein